MNVNPFHSYGALDYVFVSPCNDRCRPRNPIFLLTFFFEHELGQEDLEVGGLRFEVLLKVLGAGPSATLCSYPGGQHLKLCDIKLTKLKPICTHAKQNHVRCIHTVDQVYHAPRTPPLTHIPTFTHWHTPHPFRPTPLHPHTPYGT